MRLSTKSRYAVMAMCDLASRSGGKPVSLADIAQRQEISLSYLEQLFARLRRGGLVKSVRGPGGGYLPAAPLADISIAAIIQAVEADADRDRNAPDPSERCARAGQSCLTHDLWDQLGNQILWFLGRVSVEDVLAGRVPGAAGATPAESKPAGSKAPTLQAAGD